MLYTIYSLINWNHITGIIMPMKKPQKENSYILNTVCHSSYNCHLIFLIISALFIFVDLQYRNCNFTSREKWPFPPSTHYNDKVPCIFIITNLEQNFVFKNLKKKSPQNMQIEQPITKFLYTELYHWYSRFSAVNKVYTKKGGLQIHFYFFTKKTKEKKTF